MITHKLRWLTLLGLLGAAGWFLKQPLFYGLFGFLGFVRLFWYDERMESVFRRAASVAFVVGVIAYAGTFAYLGVVLGTGSQNFTRFAPIDLLGPVVMLWALTYFLFLLSFALSCIYLDLRGT